MVQKGVRGWVLPTPASKGYAISIVSKIKIQVYKYIMPNYPVDLVFKNAYSVHLPPNTFSMEDNIIIQPATLQFAGDIKETSPETLFDGKIIQGGKLEVAVTVLFTHDHYQMVFPIGSKVIMFTYADRSPQYVRLLTNSQGEPVPADPPAQIQAGGRYCRNRRHRSTRRRQLSRHRRNTRRQRKH
jgi:hypothetical protein